MTDRQADRYEEAVSRAARARYEELSETRFACCWEHKEDGHHASCPNRPEDPEPVEVAGQESLL